MSSSFKYLNQEAESSDTQDNSKKAFAQKDAAQSFLDDKLSKNRFTQEQQTRLDDNGGSKNFGSEYDKIITNQDALDAWDNTPELSDSFYEGGWRSGKDSGEVGWSDTWNEGGNFQQIKGDGKANAAYEDRFNALTNQDNTDVDNHGAGWKNLSDMGTMGSTEQMKALASEWEQAGYDVRIQDLEGHNGVSEANIAVRKGQGPGKGERPEEEKDLIKHSPEIEQAKERVRTYEDDALSGKTSAEIYGGKSKFEFDATKGAAGIGTPMNGDSAQQANKATASFLDNKKSQVKKEYQFEAQG